MHWPPRRVLVAPDKFKGTLSADSAARAIVSGLRRAWPNAQFQRQALADGGEGFARNLIAATGGRLRRVTVQDAAARPCVATWGMLGDGRCAVFDLAEASGLARLPAQLRDPARTSTFGSGLVLRRAIAAGATQVIVGLGGSATNDGGIGMAAALGYRFLDANNATIALNGAGLLGLARIVAPPQRPTCRILVASDVDTPLFGRRGAAYQFAAQKGASPQAVRQLDRGLRRLARIARRDLRTDFADTPGAGAAGGCGFGLMTFFNAQIQSGFELLRHHLRLDAMLRLHDLVVTGEGCFDRTSLAGKAPFRMAALAAQTGIPVWGIFGRIELPTRVLPFQRAVALVGRGDAVASDAMASDHASILARAAFRLASAGSQ